MTSTWGENRTDISQETLQVILQPPPFVLLNQQFELGVWRNLSKDSSANTYPLQKLTDEASSEGQENVEHFSKTEYSKINAEIKWYEDSTQSSILGIKDDIRRLPSLTVDPCLPLAVAAKQMTTVSCKITSANLPQCSIIGKRFSITLSKKTDSGSSRVTELKTVTTRPFKLATYKLDVKAESWDEIWYKDEGGREKCMQVTVSLRDGENNVITGRSVPLKLTLLYDNDERHIEVMRQEILQTAGPPKHIIKPEIGSTSVRFRIEDVSKNHQGQQFKVYIEEDTSTISDIAPSSTPCVSIRSKRKKRNRARESSPSIRSNPVFSTLDGGGQQDGSADIDQCARSSSFSGTQDAHHLREAMTGVIRWTEEVVNNLYPLQWQIVGYATLPDGTNDFNNPRYSMPNPNTAIASILAMYSDSTREHLRVLISAVVNTESDQMARSMGDTSRISTSLAALSSGSSRPSSSRGSATAASDSVTHITANDVSK